MTGIFKIKNLTGIFFLSNNVNVIKLKRLGTSGVLAKEGIHEPQVPVLGDPSNSSICLFFGHFANL